jgi:hypothetical protein
VTDTQSAGQIFESDDSTTLSLQLQFRSGDILYQEAAYNQFTASHVELRLFSQGLSTKLSDQQRLAFVSQSTENTSSVHFSPGMLGLPFGDFELRVIVRGRVIASTSFEIVPSTRISTIIQPANVIVVGNTTSITAMPIDGLGRPANTSGVVGGYIEFAPQDVLNFISVEQDAVDPRRIRASFPPLTANRTGNTVTADFNTTSGWKSIQFCVIDTDTPHPLFATGVRVSAAVARDDTAVAPLYRIVIGSFNGPVAPNVTGLTVQATGVHNDRVYDNTINEYVTRVVKSTYTGTVVPFGTDVFFSNAPMGTLSNPNVDHNVPGCGVTSPHNLDLPADGQVLISDAPGLCLLQQLALFEHD